VKVDAVFFDAGNTLIYPDPSVGEVYAMALRRAGFPADAEQMQRQFQSAWHRLREQRADGELEYGSTEDEAKDWWRRVVRDSFGPFGQPAGFEPLFMGLWDHFASADAWRIFDDALPVLDALKRRGVGVGLISNWDVRLVGLLEGLGLTDYLDWTVISCHVGVEKPDAAVFARALQLSGVCGPRALHVGDSYREDYLGATGVGMRAAWLQRVGSLDAPAPGVTVIRSLSELPHLLA